LGLPDRADAVSQAAYGELAAALAGPRKDAVMEVADGLAEKPEDGSWTKVFAAVTTAWSERRKVRIRYTKEDGSTSERVVWPLFIERTPAAHSLYLIVYGEKKRAPRHYRIDRMNSVFVLDAWFVTTVWSSVR